MHLTSQSCRLKAGFYHEKCANGAADSSSHYYRVIGFRSKNEGSSYRPPSGITHCSLRVMAGISFIGESAAGKPASILRIFIVIFMLLISHSVASNRFTMAIPACRQQC